MHGRLRLAAGAALVAVLAVAGVVLLTGSAGGDTGKLAWSGEVRVYDSPIKTDEILYTKVENASLRDVSIDVEDVKVLDAEGEEVRSSVRFLAAFAHGIFPWSQKPDPLGDFERRRLGEITTLKPGQTAPVTLSWRVPEGAPRPTTVRMGDAELAIPRS